MKPRSIPACLAAAGGPLPLLRGALLLMLLGACGAHDDAAPAHTPATGPAPGYLLLTPLRDTRTYLIDAAGEVVHSWRSAYHPGNSVYLLEDGDLLRCARLEDNPVFHGGGEGGRVQRFSWEGELEWDFLWSDATHLAHHDIAPLPNGNLLLLSWTLKTRDEALAAGLDPALLEGDALWPDSIFEIRPREPKGGEVVWEWHLWDHLVQDFDPQRANHGVVAEHPELIDLNARRHLVPKSEDEQRADLAAMAAVGYVGDTPPEEPREARAGGPPGTAPGKRPGRRRGGGVFGADLCHTNAIDYNAELDQIVLSVRTFSELWILDHSTTTSEAAGHSGGRSGKGGDLLYRWGNPQNYGRGLAEHRQLFLQHDARWIPAGRPGAGNLLVFNNGDGRPEGDYSSVVELAPPLDEHGRYVLEPGEPFGPRRPFWEYLAETPESFYSSFISGAERQPNGNTLICSGKTGRVFEVNSAGEVVWEYQNEFGEPPAPPPEAPAVDEKRPDKPGGRHGGLDSRALFRASRLVPEHPGLSKLEG